MIALFCNTCGKDVEHPYQSRIYCDRCKEKHDIEVKTIKRVYAKEGIKLSAKSPDWVESPKVRWCVCCGKKIGISTKIVTKCVACMEEEEFLKTHPEGREPEPEPEPSGLTIGQVAKLAADAGMTYGEYVKRYHV